MGKLFVRGDTHGDFRFLPMWCEENHTTTEDVLVILGDAGINYYGEKKWKEIKTKEFIAEQPITLFCIRGNHEARPMSRSGMKEAMCNAGGICGEMYHEPKYANIFYAKDGGIYEYNQKKILTIGGAYSVDKFYRVMMGWMWFANEQLTDDEWRLIKAKVDGQHFDYVFTHTCPFSWQPTDLFMQGLDQSTVDNSMELWFEQLIHYITFGHWFFGHYHADREDVCGDGKVTMLFNQTMELTI